MVERRLDLVPFLMYRVVARLVSRATQEFDALDVDIRISRLLITVNANPGIRVGQLADFIGLEISALSHLLRAMTRRRLVRRTRAADDQRAVAVYLTTDGASLAQQCLAMSRQHEALVLDGIAPETVEQLRQLLTRMLDNVGAVMPEVSDASLDVKATPPRARSRAKAKRGNLPSHAAGE